MDFVALMSPLPQGLSWPHFPPPGTKLCQQPFYRSNCYLAFQVTIFIHQHFQQRATYIHILVSLLTCALLRSALQLSLPVYSRFYLNEFSFISEPRLLVDSFPSKFTAPSTSATQSLTVICHRGFAIQPKECINWAIVADMSGTLVISSGSFSDFSQGYNGQLCAKTCF